MESIIGKMHEPYTKDQIGEIINSLPWEERHKAIKDLVEQHPKIGFAVGEYLYVNKYYALALGALICNYYYIPTPTCLELLKVVIIKVLEIGDKNVIKFYWHIIMSVVPGFMEEIGLSNKQYKILLDLIHAENLISILIEETKILRADMDDLKAKCQDFNKN